MRIVREDETVRLDEGRVVVRAVAQEQWLSRGYVALRIHREEREVSEE